MVKISRFRISKFKDDELSKLNQLLDLNLNLEELRAIRSHYVKEDREATDLELYTFSQVWSEHCFHKMFKSNINFKGKVIEGLLNSFIFKATRELNKSWCLSVFADNAGIVEFNEDYAIAVKVETHNHPTAIDPFSGAHTGVGGVYRDILGVGARPIAGMDYLFFAPVNLDYDNLPKGVFHPKIVMKRVVEGIADYGNKVGIPTVNGSIHFNIGYLRNPLVFVGCVGILPKKKYVKNPRPGDAIVLVGGLTGRDGIRGASFASSYLSSKSAEIYYSAVQIGNPIEEKKIIEVIIRARDEKETPLYSMVTDLGGGGLAVAVCESFKNLGCIIDLGVVPLKYEGMDPWEIWISESQERMLLTIPKENLEKFLEICDEEGTIASVIGEITDSGRALVYYRDMIAGNIDLKFLFKGIPLPTMRADLDVREEKEVELKDKEDYSEDLLALLSDPNIASKEWVIRQYDHEVGARTIIKPLQGFNCDGPGDCSVIKPLYHSWKGIVISNGGNPEYSIDPYKMALSAIDEAIRNNVAAGGRRIALLDNFSWGDPRDERELGKLVLAAEACYKGSILYDAPFISGKDSLYNIYYENGRTFSIPPTLVITAVGIIPDVRKAVTMDFKRSGNYIYMVGFTLDELGGSAYYRLNKIKGGRVPSPNPESAKVTYDRLIKAMDRGLVKACHDCSEGGLAVALAEMCIGGNLGAEIELNKVPTNLSKKYKILFSETNSRFLVEVAQGYEREFEHVMKGVPLAKIGYVKSEKELVINSSGNELIRLSLGEMIKAWKNPLSF